MGDSPILARWFRLVRRKPQVEVDEEIAFHLDERVAEYVAQGMDPDAARATALQRLGDVDGVRRQCTELLTAERRAEARRERPGISWLDLKLGVRMLGKYPGLTVVGGLAMAFAIWVGAGTFEFIAQVIRPTLPLDEGDRVVAIWNWDVETSRPEHRALHDFVSWREDLRSIEDVGAFLTVDRNLLVPGGVVQPIEVAEMSPAGFRLARVPALLGRTLVESDGEPGAPPALVIGHDLWRTRFASDPDVVGRQVHLGEVVHTVVGVMPEGFGFPVNHIAWVPLPLNPLDHARREGPSIRVFGRLAPGFTLEEAQSELTAYGQRMAAAFPDTHARLRPQVLPYARSVVYLPAFASFGLASMNLLLVMLLVLVCGNVALLMFARAATRENEIVVRHALGASRGRIVAQLFAEALVLVVVAAAIGLAGVGVGMRWGFASVEAEMLNGSPIPFWFHPSLSPSTLIYAGLLTLLAAAIAGVVPALKVTRGLATRLRAAAPGGGGSFRFGGLWTVLIVAQVAVTVTFPAVAYFVRGDAVKLRSMDVGFPTTEYLAARTWMEPAPLSGAAADSSQAAFRARFGRTYQELERRLEAEPEVVAVTFAERLPTMYHPHRRIEVDEGGAAPIDSAVDYRVSSTAVALDFFETVNAPILLGRGFHSGDLAAAARTVIVNESFVRIVLSGGNPIGRRLRYLYLEESGETGPAEEQPWYEIVGVVRDMGMAKANGDSKIAGIYQPATAGGAYRVNLALHLRSEPAAFIPRLRTIAGAVDPTLQLHGVTRLDEAREGDLQFIAFWYWLLVVVSSVAMFLSLAGIYSVLSFTVWQRTREIGIRVALGGDGRGVALAIFRRPLLQVAAGVLVGMLVTAFLAGGIDGSIQVRLLAQVAMYGVVMLAVCLLASIVPTRRALQVEPMEALRVDG